MHCTVRTNQVTEFKYVMLIENILTKQWRLDKALDVARVRVDYEKLLLKQRKVVEAFISLFVCLAAGYGTSSVMATFHCIRLSVCTLHSWGSASSSLTKHRTDTPP